MSKTKTIRVLDDVVGRLKFIRGKRQEYLVCLSIGSDGRIIRRRTVTIGLLDSTQAHPREVFAGAIKDRAKGIVIAHNHPSGDPHPSDGDIEVTQQLAAAGTLLGIPLLDHVIVAKQEIYSFKDSRLL
jgi:DNA repair protein RadC